MDDSISRNLDTQSRMLSELEANLDAVLADTEPPPLPSSAEADARLDFDALTKANDVLRAERDWNVVDLDAALSSTQRERFSKWLDHQRLPWTEEDYLVLGFAGAVGVAATLFDKTLDQAVTKALHKVHDTSLIEGWERAGKQLPIDYTGPGVGGPSHRLRSAGHDLGRPLEALRQIREGQFRGTAWIHGVKTPLVETLPNFRGVDTWPAAMIVWAKHLAADVVTPMSLPLPGFTKLRDFDNYTLAKFADAAYQGPGRPLGQGLNVRSGLITPSLAVLSTEAIVRSHMLVRSYRRDGTLSFSTAESALQTELLLAGHGLVGAAALGKSLFALLATSPAYAVRHLNIPVMLRIGTLALSANGDRRTRNATAAPSWDELLGNWAQPWQLDSARRIEQAASVVLQESA